jgi:translation initiation factor 1 (eIF-1/SUI1)
METLMARHKESTRVPLGDVNQGPTSSPFGALAGLRDQLPATTTTAMTADAAASMADAPAAPGRLRGTLVVRLERKGHGGKPVTIVSGVEPAAREALGDTMKKKLGTGARLVGDDIVVQGEIVDRVVALLQTLGAAKIVRGSR